MQIQYLICKHVCDVQYNMADKLIDWPVKYNPAGQGGRPQKCLAETLVPGGRLVLTIVEFEYICHQHQLNL